MDLAKRNNALYYNSNYKNGADAEIAITVRGSDFYFAICSAMGASAFAVLLMGYRKPRTDRIFHYLCASILMVACIAYFTMGSNLGFTPIQVEFPRSNPKVAGQFREIFYVRYIDWFITTPLLLMDLLLTAGMPWPQLLFVILVDEIMIVTGLVGALTQSIYKWGYFAFGCFALMYILYHLLWESRRHASLLGADVSRAFTMCGSLTVVLWILYPIAWGVCEGGNVIPADSEAVFYGVLDFFAKPIFSFLLIWGHRGIDPARLGLRIRDYDEDMAVRNQEKIHREGPNTDGTKPTEPGVDNGVTAPTTGPTTSAV